MRTSILSFYFVIALAAQQAIAPVPRLVRFSASLRPADGLPLAPIESATLSVYREKEGGDALWHEIQNVNLEPDGRYSGLLGSTLTDGLPADLFASGEPRWLGVRFNRPGESEQSRVLLVSVPYALKAADAETLGGRPASAYLLAPSAEMATSAGNPGIAKITPRIASGSAGRIPMFTNTTDLGDSVLLQNGARIGLGTSVPADAIHVAFNNGAGTMTGLAVQNLNSGAGAYSGTLFYDHAGVLGLFQGFNNATHEYRINNIASGGTINFMVGSSSKLLVANSGNIGIGTTTPASKLDVTGDINFTGTLRYQGLQALQFQLFGNTALGSGNLATNTGTGNTALGTTVLAGNTTGSLNTGVGYQVLIANTAGNDNTAIGFDALQINNNGGSNTAIGSKALASNTDASQGTAVGYGALQNNIAVGSTAIGFRALNSNTSGSNNTATGNIALFANTTGAGNTATGNIALFANTTGAGNTADGSGALQSNTTGGNNTATGLNALAANTFAFSNTADGAYALVNNTTGGNNTATGTTALRENTTGQGNTANGSQALQNNLTGNFNAATGYFALFNNQSGDRNTACGASALLNNTTGSDNIAIGMQAALNVGFANSNNIHIGSPGILGDGGTIRIGKPGTHAFFFAAGIRGVTTAANDAIPVVIDSNGQLGTVSSSRRFKDDIQDMGAASSDLLRLRPVTYRYKDPFADGSKPIQYGLIAEEVAEVYPDLVAHSADGQIETVKYQVLDTMLLNEVQRQQKQIGTLEQQLHDQRQQNTNLQERLARLEAAVASLSAHLPPAGK